MRKQLQYEKKTGWNRHVNFNVSFINSYLLFFNVKFISPVYLQTYCTVRANQHTSKNSFALKNAKRFALQMHSVVKLINTVRAIKMKGQN